MLFEVFDGKRRVSYTDCQSCVPSKEECQELIDAGLTIMLNGKKINKSDLKVTILERS